MNSKNQESRIKNQEVRKQIAIIPDSCLLILDSSRGDILLSVLVFSAIAVTIIIGLVNWGAIMLKEIRNVTQREQAFQIAEAGVDYYQWHLATAPNDYLDGTTTPAPYVHKFYDKDGNLLGNFSLTITPPITGSTIVKIKSVGTLATSTVSRTVQESLAIPSLARFAAIANDFMYFGSGTTVYGPVQSNYGIHFNGFAQNLISSAVATYTDPDTGLKEWGIFTTSGVVDPQPPTPVNSRPDVFAAGRQFPVPSFPFASLAGNLNTLWTAANSGGGKEWTASGALGYHIAFKVVGGVTKYDIYKVNSLVASPSSNCTNSQTQSINQTGWGTWSINTQTIFQSDQLIPTNDIIFVDDNVWVDGTINNARITLVAGVIGASSNYPSITINNSLLYTNTNGVDVIGLVSQGNVNVGLVSLDDLTIDAALVAENGRVGRYYYNTDCSIGHGGSAVNYYTRNSLSLLGMIASNVRYGFAYSNGTGYAIRNINYDGNLLYGPPPLFPSATTQYQVISWQQLQ